MAASDNQPINLIRHALQDGRVIAEARLNLPKSLNALNLEMVEILIGALNQWRDDAKVIAIVLTGEGEKAFCAGGDVVSLHNAMQTFPGQTPESVQQFFSREYELDYLIHTYSKPIVCWGKGFIMGGGIGLFAGAQYRVVTETTRLAMPEISIGLFPDVGGSYFLNQVPDNLGLFLGLTGVQVNGTDAKNLGMATHLVAAQSEQGFIDALLVELSQSTDTGSAISSVLAGMESTSVDLPVSHLEPHREAILAALEGDDLTAIVGKLIEFSNSEDKWLSRAGKTLRAGSPITMHLVFEQLRRAKGLSLLDCFKMELVMACRCAAAGEFQEGVRALLIDKDGAPHWQYQEVSQVPKMLIDRFFQSTWDGQTHPLAHLKEC